MEKANQIVKLSMAINTLVLEDMEIPDSYINNLPKVRQPSNFHTSTTCPR